MIIFSVGSVCKYTFEAPFVSLNGVYQLIEVTSFAQCIADNISIVDNFYTPAGSNSTQYQSDYSKYVNGRVLVLQTVTGSTPKTYYAPEAAIATVPDPTVRKYPNITISFPVGAFKDETTYTTMIPVLQDIVSAYTGESNNVIITEDSLRAQWLTEAEYQAMDTARQANIKRIQPAYLLLQQARDEITQMRTLLNAYEQVIISYGQNLPQITVDGNVPFGTSPGVMSAVSLDGKQTCPVAMTETIDGVRTPVLPDITSTDTK